MAVRVSQPLADKTQKSVSDFINTWAPVSHRAQFCDDLVELLQNLLDEVEEEIKKVR